MLLLRMVRLIHLKSPFILPVHFILFTLCKCNIIDQSDYSCFPSTGHVEKCFDFAQHPEPVEGHADPSINFLTTNKGVIMSRINKKNIMVVFLCVYALFLCSNSLLAADDTSAIKPYIESIEQAKEGMTLWEMIQAGKAKLAAP